MGLTSTGSEEAFIKVPILSALHVKFQILLTKLYKVPKTIQEGANTRMI